jgi:hypothetical protein
MGTIHVVILIFLWSIFVPCGDENRMTGYSIPPLKRWLHLPILKADLMKAISSRSCVKRSFAYDEHVG